MTPPLYLLEERVDGTLEAVNELHPASTWFSTVERPVPYRLWDGVPCFGINGELYREAYQDLDASWPGTAIPTNIVDAVTRQRYGFLQITGDEDLPFQIALDRYLSRHAITDSSLENGEYVLLGPGADGRWDSFDEPTLLGLTSLAYLRVPKDFTGMREWMRKHPMKGLLWVATMPDGRQQRSVVEVEHLFPGTIQQAG